MEGEQFGNWFLKALEGGRGIQWLLSSADAGNVESQHTVGRMYLTGEGLPKDAVLAEKYLRLAAKAQHDDACFLLSKLYFGGDGPSEVAQNLDEAAKLLEIAALQGHRKAQCNLGVMYSRGYGVKYSRKMAIKFFELAAEQDHVESQYNLGVLLSEQEETKPQSRREARMMKETKPSDEDLEKDLQCAVDWLTKASMKGHANAAWRLFALYLLGQGRVITPSGADALHWLRIAGKNGHARALFELGTLYREGVRRFDGAPEPLMAKKDQQAALRYLSDASQKGHGEAMCNLGVMYYEGMGLYAPNPDAGFSWMKRAAERNIGTAQYNLGLLARANATAKEDGEGGKDSRPQSHESSRSSSSSSSRPSTAHTPRDITDISQAVKWFHRAALNGHGGAAYELGMMYHSGAPGLLKDYGKAQDYLRRASEDYGHEDAAFALAKLFPSRIVKPAVQAVDSAPNPIDLILGSVGKLDMSKKLASPPPRPGVPAGSNFDRPGRRLLFAGGGGSVKDMLTVRHGLLQPVGAPAGQKGL